MVERSPLSMSFAYGILLVGLIFALAPLYLTLCSATTENSQLLTGGMPLVPGSHLLDNLQQVATRLDLLRLLGNSLLVASMVVIGKLALSALTAFAVVYFRSPLRPLIFALVLGALLLPIEVRIVPTYAAVGDMFGPLRRLLEWLGLGALPLPTLNLLDTYSGLALPLVASATGTFLFVQFYRTVPGELVEAAQLDGVGPWRFFVDILLPLSKTNFAALGTLVFVGAWKDYLWPLLATDSLSMRTIVLGVATFVPNDPGQVPQWSLLMTATMISLVPPLLVIALMHRWFVKGLIGVGK